MDFPAVVLLNNHHSEDNLLFLSGSSETMDCNWPTLPYLCIQSTSPLALLILFHLTTILVMVLLQLSAKCFYFVQGPLTSQFLGYSLDPIINGHFSRCVCMCVCACVCVCGWYDAAVAGVMEQWLV
jgi:hypothetical protein